MLPRGATSTRLALASLLALTIVRLVVAGCSALSPDEAYYWTWSHALSPGYLDHPPMTALWIRGGTSLFGDTSFGVRLLSPIAAGLGTLLLAGACSDLLGGPPGLRRRRALVAAALLNATLLLGVGAVTITPDTPLLFFWTAALFALGRVLATRQGAWWLAAGAAIGLAMDSKYTVVLPGAGLALWLLATGEGRLWLRTRWPWLAGLMALLLFTPVFSWNADHGWASFVKQGGRTGDWHPADAGRYLAELLGGQAGLATPLIFILFVYGFARLLRRPVLGSLVLWTPGESLLVFVTLPAVGVFVEHALGDRVQANWPSLLYPAAAIAAALLVTDLEAAGGRRRRRWRNYIWQAAAAFGLLLTSVVYLQSTAAPFSLPRKLDITLARLGGWQQLAAQVAARRFQTPDDFVMADDYGLAAELAFALPDHAVLAAQPRWRLFRLAHPDVAGRAGLLLRTARRRGTPDALIFSQAVLLGTVQRARAGQLAETYHLYRVTVRPDLTRTMREEIVRLPCPRR